MFGIITIIIIRTVLPEFITNYLQIEIYYYKALYNLVVVVKSSE